jgi:hypothetical protein
MAVSPTPIFLQSPKWAGTAYTTASTTATHVTGGTNGSRVSSLTAVSNSTSAHVFAVGISTGGAAFDIGSVSVTAGAGTDGSVRNIDLMSPANMPGLPLDSNGVPYINLPSTSHSLTVRSTATINTGKQVTFTSMYGDY